MTHNHTTRGVTHAADNGELSPFELDILAQPAALRDFLSAPALRIPITRPISGYERIIVTGIGSSHYAGLRTWRRLVAAGLSAWWVDTTELLDSLELLAADSLLLVTSQSGASGETMALLDALKDRANTIETIGVTNDESSPLGRSSLTVVPLRSGKEATVSTKSYINTLAAHEILTACLLGNHTEVAVELELALDSLATDRHAVPAAAAATTVTALIPRIVLVGGGDHAATALYGGLIIKEATKLPAEGFIAGNFRHGPLEMAGPGLTALFIGVRDAAEGEPLRRLAADVAATGASVLTLGNTTVPGCESIVDDLGDGFVGLARGALICQRFSVSLAQARGIVPGEFCFGQKVTAL